MKNRLIREDQPDNQAEAPNETLKATALLYLGEALQYQEFEDAPDIIRNAKRFGAEQAEIDAVIAQYLFGNEGGQDEENYLFQDRQRF